jgi:hypothetical protein
MSPAEFQRCNECRALNEPAAVFCSRCGAALPGALQGGGGRKRRRITAAGVAKGFTLLLVLAITTVILVIVIDRALGPEEKVDVYNGQSGTTATISTPLTHTTGTSSTGTSSTGAAVLIRPTAATASSYLKATESNSYRATNLLDGDLTTAWNEGAEGVGLGEWVRFEFSQQTELARLEIANGYQKDDERFAGNPRVKTIRIEYSTGTSQLVDLLDIKEFQTINTTRTAVEWLKLTIVSVYPGEEWEDTALSEVRIYERAD